MQETRKCSKCKQKLSLNNFNKRLNGLSYICKECNNTYLSKYRHTKKGLITNIFGSQKRKSRKRKHPKPSYNSVELRDWALSKGIFHEIFNKWVQSNFNKDLIPSFDRLDDYKPYTLDNLRITTWMDNNQKGYDDRRKGINNKISKAVIGTYKNTNKKIIFFSIKEAERVTGVDNSSISKCCRKKVKSAGDYVWEYKD